MAPPNFQTTVLEKLEALAVQVTELRGELARFEDRTSSHGRRLSLLEKQNRRETDERIDTGKHEVTELQARLDDLMVMREQEQKTKRSAWVGFGIKVALVLFTAAVTVMMPAIGKALGF